MCAELIDRIGVAKLAKGFAISIQAVTKWKSKGVPAERVRGCVRIGAGIVTPHDLRPDLFPPGFEFPPDTAQPKEQAA